MRRAFIVRGLVALLLATIAGGCASTHQLRAFGTDGCSLFPDRSPRTGKDWCACCVEHDRAYWRGGTRQERKQADRALKACVAGKTGNPALASLMHAGVRIGGTPYLPLWFRWGYGWGYGRHYRPLSETEQAQATVPETEYLAHLARACPVAAEQH